ncbi:MAG TPA: O-antigen ligase family protein [Chitinophagales bacterium]|nr:O-antigen ligase family protein [Chitinophagales bacterium]
MQTNTDFNVPSFFIRHDKPLFLAMASLSVLSFLLSIYLKIEILFLLPFLAFFLGVCLLNFRFVFLLMLFVMPISVEMEIGSFGTDLPSEPIVILLSICTMLYAIRNFHLVKNAIKHPIFIFLCFLYLWSWFTVIFSTNVFLSVKYMLAKSWYLLTFFVLPIFLLDSTKRIRQFFWCLFIPSFISIIFIMIRHGMQGFTFDSITDAVHPIYRNHVNYAVFITMLLPFIFLARTWYSPKSFPYKLLNFSVLFFLLAIYLSYTRGAWLAVIAMLVYFFVLKWNVTKQLLLIAGIAVIAFTVYILNDNNYLKYSPNYDTTIYHDELGDHLSSTFEMEDMSTVERFYRWIAAVHLFKEHPLLGVGPNNFVSHYKPYTVTAYETYISDNEEKSTVHNYFLLLLTEQGLPALILFICLLIVVLLTAQKLYNQVSTTQRKYIVAITLCIIAFLLNNSLSDLVEANKVGSLFYICLALLLHFSVNNISTEEDINKLT